jgi:hypothetical protein
VKSRASPRQHTADICAQHAAGPIITQQEKIDHEQLISNWPQSCDDLAVQEGFQPIYSHGTELLSPAACWSCRGRSGSHQMEALPPISEVAMRNVESLLAAAIMTQADIVKLVFF